MPENKTRKIIDERDSAAVYDKAAQDFRQKAPELLSYKYMVRPSIERALERFVPGVRNDLKVLDVGSASGRNVHTLMNNGFIAPNILGVEISPEQVTIAKKEIPEASFEVGDISTHELARDRNDLAIMIMVPEFLDDQKYAAGLKKIYDSMVEGGVFIYITTHPDRYNVKYGVADGGREVSTHGPWSEDKFSNYVRSVDEQKKAMQEVGFKVEKVEELKIPEHVEDGDMERLAKFEYPKEYARLTLVLRK